MQVFVLLRGNLDMLPRVMEARIVRRFLVQTILTTHLSRSTWTRSPISRRRALVGLTRRLSFLREALTRRLTSMCPVILTHILQSPSRRRQACLTQHQPKHLFHLRSNMQFHRCIIQRRRGLRHMALPCSSQCHSVRMVAPYIRRSRCNTQHLQVPILAPPQQTRRYNGVLCIG